MSFDARQYIATAGVALFLSGVGYVAGQGRAAENMERIAADHERRITTLEGDTRKIQAQLEQLVVGVGEVKTDLKEVLKELREEPRRKERR